MYIGLLVIPESAYGRALDMLQSDRDAVCYHREVHFSQLRNAAAATDEGRKTSLAQRWVDRLLCDDQKVFHFHLLGIELTKMQTRAFGESQEHQRNAYSRFFRSSATYAIKSFFPDQDTVIYAAFHDRDKMEHHRFFDWHLIWRLERDGVCSEAMTDRVRFIDSEHTKETEFTDDSHFVQFCDLIMGGFIQCLDARNRKVGCCEIGNKLLPLLERLTDRSRCRNPHSRFRYLHRIAVSFFPSRKLALHELTAPYARARSAFYVSRRLLLREEEHGQLRLF